MNDGEPETAVSASLQKIKSIKNQYKKKNIFYFIKSQTSDSFVNHFDGHFAYLKTLYFSFKDRVPSFAVTLPSLQVSLQVRLQVSQSLSLQVFHSCN